MSGQSGTKVIIIKKKAKHGGHHGGAWKVAYADFVTAMMALFIVLWLLTQTDQASKAALADYFRTGILPGGSSVVGTPGGSNPPVPIDMFDSASSGTPSDEEAGLRDLATSIQTILDKAGEDPELERLKEHVRVKVTPDGTLIELIDSSDNFLFAVASSELKPTAVHFLSKLAPILGQLKNKLEINGHTDARQFDRGGKKKNNWNLSFERANEARSVLEQNGVPAGRIVGVLAHADSQLFDKSDPYAAQNRRLSILITKGVKKKPAVKAPSAAPAPAEPAAPGH